MGAPDKQMTVADQGLAGWRPFSTCSKVFYELGRLVNANSACVIVVEGQLCGPTLTRSAQELARVHPLLRSVIERRGVRLGWTETAQQVQVIELDLADAPLEDVLPGVVSHAWTPVFEVGVDIPFRVQVFRNARYTIVQLITSHITEDARASYEISNDFERIYACLAGQAADWPGRMPAPAAPMDRVLFPGTGALGWARHALRAACDAARDLLIRDITLPIQAEPRFEGPAMRAARGFIMRDIEPALFQALRAAAKARGATVHALMLLAMCRIIWRRAKQPRKTIRMVDMFSLRPHGGQALEKLYEIAVIPYQLRVHPGSDKECLRQITRRVDSLRAGEYRTELLRYRLTLKLLASIRHLPSLRWLIGRSVQARVLVSNPGKVPFRLDTFAGLPVREFITYPQLFSPGVVMTQFSGYLERVRAIMIFDPLALGPGGGEALFEEFLAELRTLAAA